MNKFIATITCVFLFGSLFSQSENEEIKDSTKVQIGKGEVIFVGFDSEKKCKNDSLKKDKDDWSGLSFSWATNGYLTPDNSIKLPAGQDVMSINYKKSRSFTIMSTPFPTTIIGERFYISSGVGITWNRYYFENNVAISATKDSTIFSLDTVNIYDVYKLRATYLQIPLILGLRIGNLKNPTTIQFGAIGGYNIGSCLRMKYEKNNKTYKNKIKEDYNFSPFKIDAIARINFDGFGIFATYALTTAFEKDKAPELYPFSIGIAIGDF